MMTRSSSAGARPRQALREAAHPLPSVESVDIHVGRRIRERRIALGVSQGALGRQLGLTFSQVQKYEKGTNRVGAGRLYRLAALLDVPVQYFFEGIGERSVVRAAHSASRTATSVSFHEALAGIADPQARQALLTLAQSMASEGTDKTQR